jgi:hypothetical protein
MYIHICTYMHTYMYTYIHRYILTHLYLLIMYTNNCVYIKTNIYMCSIFINMCLVDICIDVHICTYLIRYYCTCDYLLMICDHSFHQNLLMNCHLYGLSTYIIFFLSTCCNNNLISMSLENFCTLTICPVDNSNCLFIAERCSFFKKSSYTYTCM